MNIVNLGMKNIGFDVYVVVWAYPVEGEPVKILGAKSLVFDWISRQQQPYFFHQFQPGGKFSTWGFVGIPLTVVRIREGAKKWAIFLHNDMVASYNRMPKEFPIDVKNLILSRNPPLVQDDEFAVRALLPKSFREAIEQSLRDVGRCELISGDPTFNLLVEIEHHNTTFSLIRVTVSGSKLCSTILVGAWKPGTAVDIVVKALQAAKSAGTF